MAINLDEMLLKAAIDPAGALQAGALHATGATLPYALGRAAWDFDKKLMGGIKKKFDARMGQLEAEVDPGPLPEPKTPTTVPGQVPPDMMSFPDVGGISLAARMANNERNAAARRMANEKADFARQGMQYYAPGIGFKGEFAKPGPASAFGQTYNATQGTVSNPVAKGSEHEQEMLHAADMRMMGRDVETAQMENRLAQASMSPAEVARLEALRKTQYRVDPVEQQAFGMGLKMANARKAALDKAWNDAGGDPEKFAKAKMRVDELYPLDAETLISNALGQRAAQAGILGLAGE